MSDGEGQRKLAVVLKDTITGVVKDSSGKMAEFHEETAAIGEKTSQALVDQDANIAGDLAKVHPDDAARMPRAQAGSSAQAGAAGGSGGTAGDILRRLSHEGGDGSVLDDTRQMATETPSMGWKSYNELSPKSKSLARALDRDGTVDIGPGEVSTKNLAELTRGYNGEVAVIQGPSGDLRLIRGSATSTKIPDDLARQGYTFTVHTHPEDRVPGEYTDLDRARGLRNSMQYDLASRANGAATHIEAVINRLGDVTHFDHTGILSTTQGSLPGGPINHLGFVVPVRG
jgi:hypothetical protein